jgi:hypothetical protein
VTRRPMLALASILTTLALVVGACNQGANAPALTDPTEILNQTIASFKNVTTIEFVGALSGEVEVAELGGSLDLSSTTIAGAIDIPNQKGKVTIDAPSLLGTKLEAILLDGFAYVKIDGMLATMAGMTPGKYTKMEIPEESDPVSDPSQVAESVDEANEALEKLPTPTKQADEKCGDQDCYHITIAATAEELAEISPEAGAAGDGDVTIDIWSRKSDLRPAKLQVSLASEDMGTVGFTIDFKYDVTVDVSAPPADQVVEE